MKKLLLILTLTSTGLLQIGCGSDSKGSTTTRNRNIPTYSSTEDCDSSHLNPTVTTDIGVIRVGIPGNTDCPYRKGIHRSSLHVEAYVMRTSGRNAFSIGLNGISGNLNCSLKRCWTYKYQCPPHFSLVQQGSNSLVYASFESNYSGFNNRNRFDRRDRFDDRFDRRDRRDRYDDRFDRYDSRYDDDYRDRDRYSLPSDRVWCSPMYGSRWYDEYVDRNHSYYL